MEFGVISFGVLILSLSSLQTTVWGCLPQITFTQKLWTILGCSAQIHPPLPGTDPRVPPFLLEHGTSLTITVRAKDQRYHPNSTVSSEEGPRRG